MSLLDGPHTITVIPMTKQKDRYGAYKFTRGTPVIVEGVGVDPYGSQSYAGLESDDGTSVNDQIVIRIGRIRLESQGLTEWPGGSHSIVVFDGVEYDQVGLPKVFQRGSKATNHVKVRASRRSAEVK